ncbi:septum formation initiator [Streptomyces somaliensis]|uniref:septum site-determining protein Ssd n=1 Tax=Streptomyces somaliensis TaxID=78355 RepID=UPI0020CE27E8|nr:septum site-determining protein Ssd [Streptomyces somaliensis]MCP9945215.1 septum formation initiator [Streptomyces somaliensis]MCP9974388.1 septum formation initiator [Streptomyces somaliensis]
MAEPRTTDRPPAADGRRAAPLIVTEDVGLLDDLLRLCAAAGCQPVVHHAPPDRKAGWEAAPLVIVGDDAAARCRGASRRPGVLLVGRGQDDPGVWRRGVEVGAENVLRLPDAEGWLVDRIADVVEGAGRQATTVGVLGGRGGAGASTLACALAVGAARGGHRAMLVDGDPLGGGLDVLLGAEREPGVRWPDLAASEGRIAGAALEESLPSLRGLRVLSWDRGDTTGIPPEAVRSVLAAARRRGGAVVVDLPRRVDDATVEALAQVDVGLLVVPGELRAVAAAKRVASAAGMVLDDLRVVVRGPYAAGIDETWVAEVLGLPLAGELPEEPGLPASLDGGHPPGGSASGPLGRFCSAFWERVLAPEAAS